MNRLVGILLIALLAGVGSARAATAELPPEPASAPTIEIRSAEVPVSPTGHAVLEAHCAGPPGSVCAGEAYLSAADTRLTRARRYGPVPAGGERQLRLPLRSEIQRPVRATAYLTVLGGMASRERVLVLRQFPSVEITSTTAKVGGRPRIRLTIHCYRGLVVSDACSGSAELVTSPPTSFGDPFLSLPLSRTRRFRLGVGKERSIPIRLHRDLWAAVRERGRIRVFVWVFVRHPEIDSVDRKILLRRKPLGR